VREVVDALFPTRRTGQSSGYLEGATYFGWLGVGALGQQEAARSAAAAAIKASFMISVNWFLFDVLLALASQPRD
jgi:hypothetical protein